MPEVYFQNLSVVLCRYLADARVRIRMAVCWFSHRDIFEILLKKLRAGVQVECVLEYDSQNIHKNGLDFQKFIRLGGSLYAYRDIALMHHKFALLDERLLLTGSFNWTYNSNAENLLVSDEPSLLAAYGQEFSRLKGLSVPIRKIRPAEVKTFAAFPLFQNTHISRTDLRRRISSGAGVWWVRLHDAGELWPMFFRVHQLPVDREGLLRPYWVAHRMWDAELFDEIWPALASGAKPAVARGVRALSRRMRIGDVVFALTQNDRLLALGIAQSEPKPDHSDGASYREVQWLRTFSDNPLPLSVVLPAGFAGKYRGSAMQLVEEAFEEKACSVTVSNRL